MEQNERKVSRKSLSHKLGHFFHEFFLVVGFYFHVTLTSSLSLSLIYLSIFPKFLVFTQTDNCSFSTYWIYMGIDLIREKEKKKFINKHLEQLMNSVFRYVQEKCLYPINSTFAVRRNYFQQSAVITLFIK